MMRIRIPNGISNTSPTSPTPGHSALDLFEAIGGGEVKAVWILCTNPASSAPNIDLIEKVLRRAELVVLQDAYHPTGTTQFAHVLLPAAQWSEKEGVMTNSERRITYLPKISDPPGEALPENYRSVRPADGL